MYKYVYTFLGVVIILIINNYNYYLNEEEIKRFNNCIYISCNT